MTFVAFQCTAAPFSSSGLTCRQLGLHSLYIHGTAQKDAIDLDLLQRSVTAKSVGTWTFV